MKKNLILTVILLFSYAPLLLASSSVEKKTLAILDFSNNSLIDKEKHASLSQGLAEIMITELSKVQSLKLVERQKINSLIQEMQLSQSGIVSDAAGIEVGKLLGAHFLVFGSYMISFNNQIRVDIRIVEVETGVTIKAGEVTNKFSKLFEIIKELNKKITKDLDVKLTNDEKNALMDSETSLDIISCFSDGLELEDSNRIEDAKKLYQKILDRDPDFDPAKKRLRELSDQN